MKHLFLIFVLVIAIVGCSNQPLDVLLDQSGKHSSDIVSEVAGCYTGLAIDAEAGEYLALFDKACVDAVLGVSETTEAEGVEIIETDLSTVLSSFSTGGTDYLYKFVTFDAVVNTYTTDKSALRLRTPDGQPGIVIRLLVKNYHIDISQIFAAEQSYRFVVWVSSFENNTIFCRTADPTDSDSGRTLFDDMGQTLNTPIEAVIESIKAGETYFVFKRIVITAQVYRISEGTTLSTQQDYQSLSLTPEVSDIFNQKENHRFSVYPSLTLWTEFDETYEVGTTYMFELIVHPISGRGYFDAKDISVVTYLAD